MALIAVMKEAITNAVKHAECKKIDVSLEKINESILVSIKDDGKGIQTPGKGIGLLNIEERVRRIKGSLKIVSDKQGTVIQITL